MSSFPRSWLYVPGHRSDRVAKALGAGADAVVVDLEDAVPAAQKDTARELTVALLDDRGPDDGLQLWVRINPPGTPDGERDVTALVGRRLDGLRVPRADDPDQVRAVAERTGVPLQLLIESARGLVRASELAGAHELVAGIGLGEADLAADLLVDRDEGLTWARGTVVVAARAAGLPSPVQSVWTDVGDEGGLRVSSERGRAIGFYGRSVIHPRQIGVVHDVYTPSADELAAAEGIVTIAAEATARGEVAALGADGRFVDPAVVARARTVLDRVGPRAPSDPSAPDPRAGEAP